MASVEPVRQGIRVPAPVTCLKFSPDGVYIGVACTDKTAKIMQLDEKVGIRDVQTVQQGGATAPKLNNMCWHPQAPQFCFCGHDKIIDVWDVRASRAALKVCVKNNIYEHMPWYCSFPKTNHVT
jgi:WD40 repeat protein